MRPAPIPVTLADGTQHASIGAAARALGCSRMRVRRLMHAGTAPAPMVNVAKLALANGILPRTAHWRIKNGWSVKDATTKPLYSSVSSVSACARILDRWFARRQLGCP